LGLANGIELSCPAETGSPPSILAHNGGQTLSPYAPARRVSFSELLGRRLLMAIDKWRKAFSVDKTRRGVCRLSDA
jgi:hypothetical protein